jgi:hypothetical protein
MARSALPAGASVAESPPRWVRRPARYARAGGERIEYARGPFGKHTYMLDFDTQGRMITWQQVLTEPTFDALRVGTPRDQVLQTIGHPSEATASRCATARCGRTAMKGRSASGSRSAWTRRAGGRDRLRARSDVQ